MDIYIFLYNIYIREEKIKKWRNKKNNGVIIAKNTNIYIQKI